MNATPDNTLRSSWWRPASLFEALAGTVWLGFALAASITLLWYSAFPAGVTAVGRALATEACFAAMLWALMQCAAVLQTGQWLTRRRGARARSAPRMLALPSREAAPHPAWKLFSSHAATRGDDRRAADDLLASVRRALRGSGESSLRLEC